MAILGGLTSGGFWWKPKEVRALLRTRPPALTARTRCRWRARRGLTEAEYAALVGVSRKTINTVANAVFVPSTIIALKLARALGESVERLFSLVDG